VSASLPEPRHQARLLALSAPHSGDWLRALRISSCGLRLDDEAVRVAVGLCLGARLCEPHRCPCGANVDQDGSHGLACRRSAGRTARHQNLNDMVCRALARADVPTIKEPVGLLRSDGKRPDGLTQIPWQGGRCMTRDVTVTDTLADWPASTAAFLFLQQTATRHSNVNFCNIKSLGIIDTEGIQK